MSLEQANQKPKPITENKTLLNEGTILTLTDVNIFSAIPSTDLSMSNCDINSDIETVPSCEPIEITTASKPKNMPAEIDTGVMVTASVRRIKKNEKTMMKFTVMFVIITSSFLLTTMPLGVVNILVVAIPNFWPRLSLSQAQAVFWSRRLFMLSYALNPIIYAFMDTEFRNGTKILFSKCLCLPKLLRNSA